MSDFTRGGVSAESDNSDFWQDFFFRTTPNSNTGPVCDLQGVSQKSIQTSELVVGLADKLTNSSSEVCIVFCGTPCMYWYLFTCVQSQQEFSRLTETYNGTCELSSSVLAGSPRRSKS